jgi:hypothetical protein
MEGRCWMGPIAMHNRLMTSAEINESFQQRRVQNIASVTQVLWDWRYVTGMAGWDFTEANLVHIWSSMVDLPMGIPRGAAGTVTVPDQSGNGNDLTIPTRATYGTPYGPLDGAPDVRGWVAFIADPFWR